MKIKTKKQLNLPQLIEWGFENYVTGSIYSDDRVEAKKIRFEVGVIASMYGDMHKGDTFTVEVEEEINRETELKLVERYIFVGEENNPKYMTHYPRSLNSILESNPSEVRTTHFYTEVNDDLVLIWRDGKLVE